jgi:hypothetical protein
MKNALTVLGVTLLFAGATTCAMASTVPEIDPASAGSAIALVSGVFLLYTARRTR